MRITTQCRDVDQFVKAFYRYCEDAGVFISHARRSVGEVVVFSFDLADGSSALSGLGAVVEQFTTADNRFGRPGVVIALHRLTRSARRVFDELTSARIFAEEMGRRDQTPIPLAEARAVTSNIQMIDPETLTPIPQLPPRPLDAFPTLAKPLATPVPDVPDMPPKVSRAATVSIAAIPTRPPATRTPPSIKIPTIVMPSTPVVAHGTTPAPIASAETFTPGQAPLAPAPLKRADPVDKQPAAAPAPPVVVVAQPEPVVAQPEPVVVQPEPVVVQPEPVVVRPEPVVVRPEPVYAPVEAVIEQPDAMAEQTTRMATPPFGEVVASAPDAAFVESAAAYEPSGPEVPRLSPAPLELVDLPAASSVAEGSRPLETFGQTIAPQMVAVATARPAPKPLSPPVVVFAPQQPRAQASTRWTKRRIWAVAAFAGASMLAIGIVIGATFVGGGTRASTAASATPAAPTPAPAAPVPTPAAPAKAPPAVAPAPTEAAATPPAPTPAAEATAPTETAPPPAAGSAAPVEAASPPPSVAAAPAQSVATSPPPPPAKKPPPKKHHHHSSSARCTSLKCL